MKLTMVVPHYACARAGEGRADGAVFDHPTPLDEEGTLGRLIESIELLDDDFNLIVIAVPVHDDFAKACEKKVKEQVAALTDRPVKIMGRRGVSLVNSVAATVIGREASDRLFNTRGYPGVRNLCLAAARVCEADAVLLVDDDEVFTDPGFIGKLKNSLFSQCGRNRVECLAGLYVDVKGSPFIVKEQPFWLARWDKQRAMNRLWKNLLEPLHGLVETPFALGGNMAVARSVYEDLPFDPNVPRGEDGDYVINCRLHRVKFFFDRNLSVLHRPPEYMRPQRIGLCQDFTRFALGRRKIEESAMSTEVATLSEADFDPYPGAFLGPDIYDRIVQTSTLLSMEYLTRGDTEEAALILSGMKEALAAVNDIDAPLSDYLRLRDAWRAFFRHWNKTGLDLGAALEPVNG